MSYPEFHNQQDLKRKTVKSLHLMKALRVVSISPTFYADFSCKSYMRSFLLFQIMFVFFGKRILAKSCL